MHKDFRVAVLCLAGGLIVAGLSGYTQAAPVGKSAVVEAPPQFLRDIPQLQQKISIEVTDKPIGDVLTDVSSSLSAGLCAERAVADQRVTLHLTAQPVYLVMDRLIRLLSHHPDTPSGYHWGPLDHYTGTRPVFQLWRDTRSVGEEEYARDYPQREISVLLRDMRNMAGMPPQERLKHKSDYPYFPSDGSQDTDTTVFQGLSDDQIDALVAGQKLPIDPTADAAEVAAEHKNGNDIHEGQRNTPVVGPGTYHASPMLSVTPVSDTEDGRYDGSGPDSLPGCYLISLEGVGGRSFIVNTYDTRANRSPDHLRHPSVPGPAVDLTPFLAAKSVTRAQRRDVGFTVQALARAARISVYHEDFLRASAQGEPTDGPEVGLTTLKGTLPDVISAICVHWNYQCRKVGDDYLFSSRTWAQDRTDDIPERLVLDWRQRLQKQGCLTLDDWGEIAATLSLRQIVVTLAAALPEAGPWNSLNYEELRLVGQLSPDQKEAAFSEAGLTLQALSSEQRQDVATACPALLTDVPGDRLGHAVLTFQTEDAPEYSVKRVTMAIKLGDKNLYSTRCVIPLHAPSTPTSPASSATSG